MAISKDCMKFIWLLTEYFSQFFIIIHLKKLNFLRNQPFKNINNIFLKFFENNNNFHLLKNKKYHKILFKYMSILIVFYINYYILEI